MASYFASSGSQSSRGSRFSSVWINGLKPSSPFESAMARSWPATSRHTPRTRQWDQNRSRGARNPLGRSGKSQPRSWSSPCRRHQTQVPC